MSEECECNNKRSDLNGGRDNVVVVVGDVEPAEQVPAGEAGVAAEARHPPVHVPRVDLPGSAPLP